EWPENNHHIVSPLPQKANCALKRTPLQGIIQANPFKVRWCGAAGVPGLVSGAVRAPLWVLLRLAWNPQVNLRQRIAPGVWTSRRIGIVFRKSPDGDALLVEIDAVDMIHPGEKIHVAPRDCTEACRCISPIAGDMRSELGHKLRVVEGFFIGCAKVGLGA